MPLINHSIPNLINGVSQQSESLRLGSQAESQINGLASVVEGLKKRTPTEFIKRISINSKEANLSINMINCRYDEIEKKYFRHFNFEEYPE